MLSRLMWTRSPGVGTQRVLAILAAGVLAVVAGSVAVAVARQTISAANASAVYLIPVVAMAAVFGTLPAIATAIAAFLIYDFFFTAPYLTLTVSDPVEWENLVLFLLVAVVTGRLTALLSERAADAERRARESQALFAISRILATASTVEAAAPAVLARLASDTSMDRTWFAARMPAGERTIVDTSPGAPRPRPRIHWLLVRTPGDHPARWLRTHVATEPGRAPGAPDALFRIRLDADDETLGSLWATRQVSAGLPNREETRLLSLAADQLGLGLHRDELAASATAAEVARQSDALKTALLTSVSHDLRTPLASIRAAAGSLMDPAVRLTPDEARTAARAIDSEAERLNRLVRNLLDLSRIEGGALHPNLEVFDLDETIDAVVGRLQPLIGGCHVDVDLPPDLPPVRADAVYLDETITNLLENAARYAGPAAHVQVSAAADGQGFVKLTVEDDGRGVPPDALPRLFEKFYRVPGTPNEPRRGMGIGMSIVKGLVEAMGGTVSARKSALGGLAVDIRLPAAAVPATVATPA